MRLGIGLSRYKTPTLPTKRSYRNVLNYQPDATHEMSRWDMKSNNWSYIVGRREWRKGRKPQLHGVRLFQIARQLNGWDLYFPRPAWL